MSEKYNDLLNKAISKMDSKQKLTEKDLKLMMKSFMENILFLHHEINILREKLGE